MRLLTRSNCARDLASGEIRDSIRIPRIAAIGMLSPYLPDKKATKSATSSAVMNLFTR
jgi:hypothetical protein